MSPGATAEVVLHLRNTGEIVEAYRFDLVGTPAGWGEVEPAELSLYPGTSGTATVRLSPPRGTEPEAGRYPFALRVVPTERPEDVQVPEGMVEVLSAAELEVGLVARTRRGRFGARFQVAVRNAGNAAGTVVVGAAEPDGRLRLRARPGAEDFDPGEGGHFRVGVRPRRLILKGRGRAHAFHVTVGLEDALPAEEAETSSPAPDRTSETATETATATATATASKTVDAVFEQVAVIPAGAGKVAAAVVAVAALCAAAWFALVKPAVTSVATTEASHVAAAVVQQQASSYAPAAATSPPGRSRSAPGSGSTPAPATPTPSAPSSASPSASAATAPTAPPATPASTPKPATTATADFDTSLAVQVAAGKSGSATFTVPARSTFMVTDYVLENPQGDYGTITVTVSGTQVSVLALEDFRDDDYPWVTPLAVPAGAHVAITVDCRAAGAPPQAKPPTACSESALFNGTMTTVSR